MKYKNKITRFFVMFFLIMLISSCGENNKKADNKSEQNLTANNNSADLQFTNQVADSTTKELITYYFGIPPYQKGQPVDEIRKLYKPMLTWLGNQLGCKFDIVGAETYIEMIDMVANGRVHIASLGPVSYLKAKNKNPDIQLLLTELKWNNDSSEKVAYYNAYIVALKKRNDLNNLADLKGQIFSFGSMHSTSGYIYPNAIMRKQGIIPEKYFSKVYYLGSHPRVTDAVFAESVDAGATWDYNMIQATRKHGDVFKIIYAPPPVPNLTLVAHPTLPLALQQKVIKILPTIDIALLNGLPTAGFVVKPESYYDLIAEYVDDKKIHINNRN